MLRTLNETENQRLENQKNSSFARKNASEAIFHKGVGWTPQSRATARHRPPPPITLATDTRGCGSRCLEKLPTRLPGHLYDCDRESRGQLHPQPSWIIWPLTPFGGKWPFLTRQGQGVVPPTRRRHNHLVAEPLDESGGFNPLGVAVAQLPLLISPCGSGAGQVQREGATGRPGQPQGESGSPKRRPPDPQLRGGRQQARRCR